MISPEEVGEGFGLFCASKNAKRLFTKKKAPRREVDPAAVAELMTYVLMSRTVIVAPSGPRQSPRLPESRSDRIEKWRAWIAERVEADDLGEQIARRLGHHSREVEGENGRLAADIQRLESVRETMAALGVESAADAQGWRLDAAIREAERKLRSRLPDDLCDVAAALKRARRDTDQVIEAIERAGQIVNEVPQK